MTAPAIEITGLRKSYRSLRRPTQRALDGLDMLVEQGGVQGLLGPNGSGKTTTIRVLLGLARADGGDVRVLGHPVPAELPQVVGHVGALVENPLFLPGLSGRTSLDLLARSVGVPGTRVDHVLETVKLRERADDRVKTYSLGMRQRLGIAAALLKDPRLLILDEPSNGLDPAGMKEVRDLVRDLATDGRTIVISSHLLSEVQQVCDRVTIMSRGQALLSGPVDEVLRAHGRRGVLVGVADRDLAATTLRQAGFDVQPLPDGRLEVGVTGRPVDDPSALTELLGRSGQWVSHLSVAAADLESAFLQITAGHGLGEQSSAADAGQPAGQGQPR
ncbi:MAG TPA: ABC transporter ATP-binding protein [Actinomycetales bacterium]|nr:ABC transporter ATP-binding protein [Actinomycetales bacterium]